MNKSIAALISVVAIATAAYAEEAAPPAPEPLYATVNGKQITQKDFHAAYANHLRQKYYHGQVPEDQLAAARTEVGELLVQRILLIDEAKTLGLVANEQNVADVIAGYEKRYAASERWQKNRASMLPGLKQQLAEQDLLRQIDTIGHTVAEPTDEAVRAFYDRRIELFTEPEKQRLYTILLKIDPSSEKPVWDAARDEATRIVARLRSGEAKFEDMATLHSHDSSADKGGDMGYVHRGMIPEPVQIQIEALPLGTVSDPIDVLEGVAIFRLDTRIPPRVMPFADVAARARELLKRDQSKQAWEDFIARLRKTAVVEIAPAVATQ